MARKFIYAPGMPGYGTQGADGSTGVAGIATYFSSYSGDTDSITLKSKIAANKELFANNNLLPGYPFRIYNTGDIFIDQDGGIYQIDLGKSNLYSDTGITLQSTEFFELGATQGSAPVFTRYSNKFLTDKNLVDTVYANSNTPDYTTYPTSIYDNAPLYYSNVKYIGSDIVTDLNSYYPFQVWSIGSATNDDAIALVREEDRNTWHFGNANAGVIKDISLYLDFTDTYVETLHGTFNGDVTGDLDIDGDVSISGSIFCPTISGVLGEDLLVEPRISTTTWGYDLQLKSGYGVSRAGNVIIRTGGSGSSPGHIYVCNTSTNESTGSQAVFSNATTAIPAIAFRSNQASGFSYASATNRINVNIDGVNKAYFDSIGVNVVGDVSVSGNVDCSSLTGILGHDLTVEPRISTTTWGYDLQLKSGYGVSRAGNVIIRTGGSGSSPGHIYVCNTSTNESTGSQAVFSNATTAIPAIAFRSNQASGFSYASATNRINVNIDGVNKAYFDSTGVNVDGSILFAVRDPQSGTDSSVFWLDVDITGSISAKIVS